MSWARELGDAGHPSGIGIGDEVLEFCEGIGSDWRMVVFAGVWVSGGGEGEGAVVGEMEMEVANFEEATGFDRGFEDGDGLMISGAIGHDGAVIGVGPIFGGEFGNSRGVAIEDDGLEEGGSGFAGGPVVPAFDGDAIGDGNGVGIVSGFEDFLSADREDFCARLELRIDFQDDIARLGIGIGDGEFQFGDEEDFVCENFGERLEFGIGGDDPGVCGEGDLASLHLEFLWGGEKVKEIAGAGGGLWGANEGGEGEGEGEF